MKRIKYISSFARSLTQAEIDEIVTVSAQNNAQLGITGILMTAGNLFFQIIEGPKAAIDEVYAKICNDSRHSNVLLLNVEEAVPHRIFPEWSMRRIDLGDLSVVRLEPHRAILETIIELRQRIETLTGILERTIWSEMISE